MARSSPAPERPFDRVRVNVSTLNPGRVFYNDAPPPPPAPPPAEISPSGQISLQVEAASPPLFRPFVSFSLRLEVFTRSRDASQVLLSMFSRLPNSLDRIASGPTILSPRGSPLSFTTSFSFFLWFPEEARLARVTCMPLFSRCFSSSSLPLAHSLHMCTFALRHPCVSFPSSQVRQLDVSRIFRVSERCNCPGLQDPDNFRSPRSRV